MKRKNISWDYYIKQVKEIHGKKVTPEIETFMRYCWKDAQFSILKTTKEEILNEFLHNMRIACDGEDESFTFNSEEKDGLVKYQVNFTVRKDGD